MSPFDLDAEQCWRACEGRDARFDGRFIVGVRTTGIYCRPSCPTPVQPKRRNVDFFRTAAAAQRAGLRACKRCRPDATPGSPEWDVRADLVGRAMRLIADGTVDRDGVAGLAARLGVSERHLHRLLVEAVGAPPLALARSQRAQTARVLIETTPMQLRRARRSEVPAANGALAVRLPFRAPYDGDGLLAWLRARAVPGVEEVDGGVYRRTLTLPGGPAGVALEPRADHVAARFTLATVGDLTAAVHRVRRLLDLDADPRLHNEPLAADPALAPSVAARPGLRAPGTVDAAETAVRAVLGQQVSLAAARTLAARLTVALGAPLPEPD